MTLPDGLPPLPPVPEGFDRWEYRGTNWKCDRWRLKAIIHPETESEWYVCEAPTSGREDTHYLEAVRAEPELLTPDAVRSKLGAAEMPLTSAIFKLLDQAFLHETGYEHRFALRQGARIAVEDLERERDALKAERDRLRGGLEWIANTNAMDYEYQRVARETLQPEPQA